MHNNLDNPTGSFGAWLRCSLVTDPCEYAPRLRLASHQNSCVILSSLLCIASLGMEEEMNYEECGVEKARCARGYWNALLSRGAVKSLGQARGQSSLFPR
jgi:hypothetical protein